MSNVNEVEQLNLDFENGHGILLTQRNDALASVVCEQATAKIFNFPIRKIKIFQKDDAELYRRIVESVRHIG